LIERHPLHRPHRDSGPIREAAYDAGCTIDDAIAAIEELAVNYQLAVAANRQTDIAIAQALSCIARRRHLN
jgi:hypothetical protein